MSEQLALGCFRHFPCSKRRPLSITPGALYKARSKTGRYSITAQARRAPLDPPITELLRRLRDLGNAEGDLNYAITRLVAGAFVLAPRYRTIARITGILANVAAEFYRRVAVPYEENARASSDDVDEYYKIDRDRRVP